MFEVVRSLDFSEKNSAFVALGYYVSNDIPHAGLVIKYNDINRQFHYTGSTIEFEGLYLDFFHKITETINISEVPAFIAHCNNIKKRANIRYGFFYSGDYFDSVGNHFGNSDLGQTMTCVGFCLSTLKGFLEDDYILFTDWDFDEDFRPGYLEAFCKKYSVDLEKVKSSCRRITPGQFLASGFFQDTPIRKSQIEDKYFEIKTEMVRRAGFFE